MRRLPLPVVAMLALVAQAAGIAFLLRGAAEEACAATRAAPIGLRVLLVTADGQDPAFQSWRDRMTDDGVPFDVLVASRRPPLRPRSLVDARGRGRYQAVVLSADPLLSTVERRVLDRYERRFDVREIVTTTAPGARGLDIPARYTRLRGDAAVTTTGRRLLPGLKKVPVDGLLARPPRDPRRARVIVADRRGRALVVRLRARDGRERMVSAVEAPGSALAGLLLAPRMLDWATRGVHLGARRQYLAVQVDDVLIPNARWDPQKNRTGRRDPIRMTSEDVRRLVRWSSERDVRIDLAYNGVGAEQRRPLGCERTSDPLTLRLVDAGDAVGWLNHTYRHPDLDRATRRRIAREIEQNVRWARDTGIPIDVQEVATGEHSGLANPSMPSALADASIRWVASDASREPRQRALGPALTVPRWAPNIYYDTATVPEVVDQYNYRYSERCRPRECRPRVGWRGLRRIEAERLLEFVFDNDPRPYYVHQSNLAEDGILLPLLDALLERGRELSDVRLVQPTLSQAGEELRRRGEWAAALRAGAVRAVRDGRSVTVTVRRGTWVPLTGAAAGGWIRLGPGERRTLPIAPDLR